MKQSNFDIEPLGFPWRTPNPFLFCVYHEDHFPAGNEKLGPKTGLDGRALGSDFEIRNGYRMYHGKTVPGFPAHPHRGFETITIVETGLVDHSDSLGATGRFGQGDVQWMTAGKGVQHSEMFPLLKEDEKNPLVLFQIWLNLPRKSKMVEPHYKMLWHEDIPIHLSKDENGKTRRVKIVAGEFQGKKALRSTPDSWAAHPENDVQVWLIDLEPGARFDLPVQKTDSNRSLFFYKGNSFKLNGENITRHSAIHAHDDISINNGPEASSFLLLQGKPIDEPVHQHGPFVMNSQAEIRQAILDYQKDQFGGWPWPVAEHVHPRSKGRFAQHADGRIEERG
ncbi:MAG: pirin family protein [Luteibaculum sp.]